MNIIINREFNIVSYSKCSLLIRSMWRDWTMNRINGLRTSLWLSFTREFLNRDRLIHREWNVLVVIFNQRCNSRVGSLEISMKYGCYDEGLSRLWYCNSCIFWIADVLYDCPVYSYLPQRYLSYLGCLLYLSKYCTRNRGAVLYKIWISVLYRFGYRVKSSFNFWKSGYCGCTLMLI